MFFPVGLEVPPETQLGMGHRGILQAHLLKRLGEADALELRRRPAPEDPGAGDAEPGAVLLGLPLEGCREPTQASIDFADHDERDVLLLPSEPIKSRRGVSP